MKLWLVSEQDWDGVHPRSLHRSFETAQAAAQRLYAVHVAGQSRVKGFRAEWSQIDDTGWAYAGWQVDEMEVGE